MSANLTYLPYSDTGYFSDLVLDYLGDDARVQPFYRYRHTLQGLDLAIADREKYPVNRELLTSLLEVQYASLQKHEKVVEALELLKQENTFTICTAHQPNLLTGYLYFIYKIVHAVKLAETLKGLHPDKNFLPVYYMGSEDNDLEELGTFRYRGDKYVWTGDGQTGAVGRMKTKGLRPMLENLFKLLGPPGENCELLKEMITAAYLQHDTVSSATQYLVNEMFGRFGLIVLNPDEAEFKRAILPVLKDDLLHQSADAIVSAQIQRLEVHYKAQAHPRPVNLFYLKEGVRERIERKGGKWSVLNSDVEWDEKQLLEELESNPERFSPNVILRGVFQESILPDVAFIGGGAEVAYWLQLKTLFEHYKVFFPSIHLRQSVQWIERHEIKLKEQLGFSVQDLFIPEVSLVRQYVERHSASDWHTGAETAAIASILSGLKQKATDLDPTLSASAEAVLAKIKHQLERLEKKMLRAEKKKMQVQLQRISRLKNALFPQNGLQERVENFTEYYLRYGPSFIDMVKDGMQPLPSEFLVIEMKD